MTELGDILKRRIAASGPLSVGTYMAECLLHPQHGYYSTHDPFGVSGDFTTAPEISQMFGELLGLCLAQTWMDQGQPARFHLTEIGPGRGTLMADVLRATRPVPGFHAAMRLHLVEASPHLRNKQRATLAEFDVAWHDTFAQVPPGPLFLVANEFFDALPIRQFIREAGGWKERLVGLQGGELAFGTGAAASFTDLEHRLNDTKSGDMVEVCASANTIAAEISERIGKYGGTALIIDYGGWRSLGDTFQALRAHRPESPLASPGKADLTAHVDFEALAASNRFACTSGMVAQGVLLERLGITPRAQALAKNLAGDALKSHIAAHRRLTHPQEMGTLFKAIAFYPKGTHPPPGFDL